MYDLCRFYFAHLWYVYKHGTAQSLKKINPREKRKPFKFHNMHDSELLEALRSELSTLSDDTNSEEYHLLHEQPPFWNSFKAFGPKEDGKENGFEFKFGINQSSANSNSGGGRDAQKFEKIEKNYQKSSKEQINEKENQGGMQAFAKNQETQRMISVF